MTDRCPSCGEVFERLGTHWVKSCCPRPTIDEHQMEVLTGVLLGDGDIHGRGNSNPHFRVRMTNRYFLEYLDDLFGPLSTGVFLDRDAERQYQQARSSDHPKFEVTNRENYNDLFGFRTRSHPRLGEFGEWYSSGRKRYPDDLDLTPVVAKMWYVCDGWLAKSDDHGPRAMIRVTREADRPEFLQNLFDEAGVVPHFTRGDLRFTVAETEQLLEWMGSPPPGFAYKWPME